MNEEIDIVEKIFELVKASNAFDLASYEQTLSELEKKLGKEVEHKEETKEINRIITKVKEDVLNALSGETTLENIGQATNALMQFQDSYVSLKKKYMYDEVDSLIDYVKAMDDE